MKKKEITVKKILIISTGSRRNVIYTFPLINTIKNYFKNTSIHLIVKSDIKSMVENQDQITGIILDQREKNKVMIPKNFFSYVNFIKTYNFDVIINLELSFFYTLVGYFAKIPIRIGHNKNHIINLFLTNPIYLNRHNIIKHIADKNLDLLKPLLNAWKLSKEFNLSIDENLETKIKKKINYDETTKYILITVDNHFQTTNWSAEEFNYLLEHINHVTNFKVIFFSESNQRKYFNNIKTKLSEPYVDLTDYKSINDIKVITNIVDTVIGSNSEIIHIATALKKPIISLINLADPLIKKDSPWNTNHILINETSLKNDPNINPDKSLDKYSKVNDLLLSIKFLLEKDIVFPKTQELYWFKMKSTILIHIFNKNRNEIEYFTKLISILNKNNIQYAISTNNKECLSLFQTSQEIFYAPFFRVFKWTKFIRSKNILIWHSINNKKFQNWQSLVQKGVQLMSSSKPFIIREKPNYKSAKDLIQFYITKLS